MPGLVTSVAGLLLLLPPTRAAARPLLGAMAVRGIGRRFPLITVVNVGADAVSTAGRDPTTSTARSSTSPRSTRRPCRRAASQ